MAACLEALIWAKKFDDEIYLLDSKRVYSLISMIVKGMQTGKGFLELLKWLSNRLEVSQTSPNSALIARL